MSSDRKPLRNDFSDDGNRGDGEEVSLAESEGSLVKGSLAEGADYRDFLKEFIDQLRQKRSQYSQGAFARDLAVSPTTLSRVLAKTRHLPQAAAEAIETRFGVSGFLDCYYRSLQQETTTAKVAFRPRSAVTEIVHHLYNLPNQSYFHTQARTDVINLANAAKSLSSAPGFREWDEVSISSEEGYQCLRQGDVEGADLILRRVWATVKKLSSQSRPHPPPVQKLRITLRVLMHMAYVSNAREDYRLSIARLRLITFLIRRSDPAIRQHFWEELAYACNLLMKAITNFDPFHRIWRAEKWAVCALRASRMSLRTEERSFFHRNVATTWIEGARAILQRGECDRALRRLDASARHLRAFDLDRPGNMRTIHLWARQSMLRSQTLEKLGCLEKSATAAQEFIPRCRALSDRDPRDHLPFIWLTRQLKYLGDFHARYGQDSQASRYYRESEFRERRFWQFADRR